MIPSCDEGGAKHEKIESGDQIRPSKPRDYILINISSTQASSHHQNWYNLFNLLSTLKASIWKITSIFKRTIHQKDEVSVSVLPIVHKHFIKKISFNSFLKQLKEWIKHPLNSAFLLWLTCVAISAVMLCLLLLGLLNNAFPSKNSRNQWIEINNQVLNALFTLMSLYQHPNLFHHTVLLFRWRPEDIIELRRVYSKNGAYHPHEFAHMIVVVTLLHITCISQYVSCGLFWGYLRKSRPELAQTLSFAIGTVCPIIAGLYTVYSPLGDSNNNMSLELKQEEELQCDRYVIVEKREWKGRIYDCNDDKCTCMLSVFCTFWVFGRNMQRLGFGNMYVHMVTFCLLCVAPFWIFSICAINICNDVVRDIVGVTGLVLCLFGLIYGGFWRIKIREKFGIDGNGAHDYVKWIFCWSCSLAQEVRTVNFYDIDQNDDTVDMENEKNSDDDDESSEFLESGTRADLMVPVQACIDEKFI